MENNKVLVEKIAYLNGYLKEKNIAIEDALHLKDNIFALISKSEPSKLRVVKRMNKYFSLDENILLDDNKTSQDLPKYEDIKIPQILFKVRKIDSYLKESKQIRLASLLNISNKKMEDILAGKKKISKGFAKIIAIYFSIPLNILLEDSEELLLDELVIDEELIMLQSQASKKVKKERMYKNSIKKDWSILPKKKKTKLVIKNSLLIVPLFAYIIFCCYTLVSNRISTIDSYVKEQALTQEEQSIIAKQDELVKLNHKEKYQVDVSIGINVAKISTVSNKEMRFAPTMQVFFDFDHVQFFKMIYNKENNQDFDEKNAYLNDKKYQHDDFGYNVLTNTFFKHADNIPDFMQLEGYAFNDKTNLYHSVTYKEFVDKVYILAHEDGSYTMPDSTWDLLNIDSFSLNQIYPKVYSQYPGLTSSNVYPDNETMFSVGHYKGSFDADSFSYEYSTPYKLTSPTGEESYRYFQSMSFSCSIAQIFNSPRYPLDSISFKIPITSEKLSYEYLRYVPVDYVDLTENQIVRNKDPKYKSNLGQWGCSIDAILFSSGTSTDFKIATGYKLINSGDVKGISKKVVLSNYIKSDSENHEIKDTLTNPEKVYYYSEYVMTLHANRSGISLFLQAFINLFAVGIWILIGFYDQSHQDEDSIGMLGTGLFGAISSILVGLSMISDAGMFSLITMINIFTLAVILIMTFSSIVSKKIRRTGNKIEIAYSRVSLKTIFIFLTLCTGIIFIVLPFISFIFF